MTSSRTQGGDLSDPIQGHPAALYGVNNRLSEGEANLCVGINDNSSDSVNVNIDDGLETTQPDKFGETIADMIITTMKHGKWLQLTMERASYGRSPRVMRNTGPSGGSSRAHRLRIAGRLRILIERDAAAGQR